jgi:hypothetical protein
MKTRTIVAQNSGNLGPDALDLSGILSGVSMQRQPIVPTGRLILVRGLLTPCNNTTLRPS